MPSRKASTRKRTRRSRPSSKQRARPSRSSDFGLAEIIPAQAGFQNKRKGGSPCGGRPFPLPRSADQRHLTSPRSNSRPSSAPPPAPSRVPSVLPPPNTCSPKRSEKRRGGKGGVSRGGSRWAPQK